MNTFKSNGTSNNMEKDESQTVNQYHIFNLIIRELFSDLSLIV